MSATIKVKPYARPPFDEATFLLALSSFNESRARCIKNWVASPTAKTDAKEEAFYRDQIAVFDRLIALFEKIRCADKSQDAEENEEEEEEEDAEDEDEE